MLAVPSAEDVAATQWEDALAAASEPTCFAFSMVLFRRAREAEEQQNLAAVSVYALLGSVASMRRVQPNEDSRFESSVVEATWRSLGESDLSEAQLDLLSRLVVHDPEMRARICDLMWSRRRGYKFAEAAVDAYIASATRLERHRNFDLFDRIERAAQLGSAIRGSSRDRVVAHLVSVLERLRVDEDAKIDFMGVKLLGLALELRAGDAAMWAEHAEHYAEASERRGQWLVAREYWQLAAQSHARVKADDRRRTASLRAAETFVREADAAASKRVGAHFLAGAVEAFRRQGERARAQELHAKMLRWQQESVGDFKIVSESIDASEMSARARAAVQGKSFADAIFTLLQLTRFRTVAELRKEVEESTKRYLHLTLFPTVVVDARGKIIGHRAALERGAAREDDDAVSSQMHANAAFCRQISAQATIEPARAEIITEHAPTVRDLSVFVENNPFVPPGREFAFAKGLHAGLFGDYLTSTHILVPQLENSIRELLRRRDVITSSLLRDGIQEERDINALLYEPAVKDIFGEDLLFQLRGILIHRFGANLRNNMAHGLLDDSAYFSPEAAYLWWLTLYIVVWPFLRAQAPTVPREHEAASTATEAADNRSEGADAVQIPIEDVPKTSRT